MSANVPQRLFLALAALWLQVAVVVFVYLQMTRTIMTPLSGWVDRVFLLFR